jgi:hypothetical protein
LVVAESTLRWKDSTEQVKTSLNARGPCNGDKYTKNLYSSRHWLKHETSCQDLSSHKLTPMGGAYKKSISLPLTVYNE